MIKRSPRNSNFTVINNNIINDPNIEWNDLGLLLYLLSKPDYWNISAGQLIKVRKAGRDAIYASLKRIRTAGYASYVRHASGKTDWFIYDEPHSTSNTDNPPHSHVEIPHEEKPREEKPHDIVKTVDLVKTVDIIKTVKTIAKSEFLPSVEEKNLTEKINRVNKYKIPFQQIIELYHKILPELPQMLKLTPRRKGYIRQRCLEDLKNMESWENFFIHIKQSDFLMGKVASNGDRNIFRADLEWITRPNNFAKISEEKYHGL